MNSTMSLNHKQSVLLNLAAIAFALLLWQAAAMCLGESFLLPSPLKILSRLFTIWREDGFFVAILHSFSRIALGFLLGTLLGCLLAMLSGRYPLVEIFLRPFMLTVKTVPVASFIILALVWLSARKLSAFISFLMVLPVIYNSFLGGIKGTDEKLLEMGRLFRLPFYKRIRFLYFPQMKENILSGLGLALGLAWKAGIAAEVIGIPGGTIGEALYQAKAYLNTTDLFCWTFIIVLLSLLFEKLVLALVRFFYRQEEARV